jgi:hypothetical protein
MRNASTSAPFRIFPTVLLPSRFYIVLLLLCAAVPISANRQFQEILRIRGFSDTEIDSVNDGALLKKVMESSNEREVAVSFACVIDIPPTDLKDIFLANRLEKKIDPELMEFGSMSSEDGSMDDFETLRLEPNGHAAAEELLKAAPGYDLHLSQEEMDAFRRHDTGDKDYHFLGKIEETMRHKTSWIDIDRIEKRPSRHSTLCSRQERTL